MPELTKVSVVVPVYNVEKYIEECLSSIVNQTYKNIEIICVDDCGDDSSMKIVQNFAKQDNRIRIIKHKKNKGLGAARNTGLKAAEGEYLLFVDSDDFISEDCVETVTDKMNGTMLNAVIFKADMCWQDTSVKKKFWHNEYRDFKEGYFSFNDDLLSSLTLYSWNKCYRKSFMVQNNIKWPENTIFEDVEFFIKFFTISPVTYMIDKVLYTYRIHGNSIMGQNFANRKDSSDLYTKVLPHVYEYFKANDLFKKYPRSFLQLINTNFNNFRSNPDVMEKNAKVMLNCLKEINFPDEYEESV